MPQVRIGRPDQHEGQVREHEQRLGGDDHAPVLPQPFGHFPPTNRQEHRRWYRHDQHGENYGSQRKLDNAGVDQHPRHPRDQEHTHDSGKQESPVVQRTQDPPGQRERDQADEFQRQEPAQPRHPVGPAVPPEHFRPGAAALLSLHRVGRQHQLRGILSPCRRVFDARPDFTGSQAIRVSEHQHLRVVIGDDVFVGVPEV